MCKRYRERVNYECGHPKFNTSFRQCFLQRSNPRNVSCARATDINVVHGARLPVDPAGNTTATLEQLVEVHNSGVSLGERESGTRPGAGFCYACRTRIHKSGTAEEKAKILNRSEAASVAQGMSKIRDTRNANKQRWGHEPGALTGPTVTMGHGSGRGNGLMLQPYSQAGYSQAGRIVQECIPHKRSDCGQCLCKHWRYDDCHMCYPYGPNNGSKSPPRTPPQQHK